MTPVSRFMFTPKLSEFCPRTAAKRLQTRPKADCALAILFMELVGLSWLLSQPRTHS